MHLPHFLQIEPVGRSGPSPALASPCHADSHVGQVSAFMNFTLFKQLIGQYPDLSELHLQGLGDPLTHLHFFEMVRYAVARGIRVSTNTSLTILPEYRAQECVESGLHTMYVTINSMRLHSDTEIRIKSRFEKTLRNLRRLMAAKAQADSALPHVHLACALTRENLPDLPDLVQLAHAEGISQVSAEYLCQRFGESALPLQLQAMPSPPDAQSLLQEDPERVAFYFEKARSRAASLGVDLSLPDLESFGTSGATMTPSAPLKKRCAWPWRGAYISHEGHALPCCMAAMNDARPLGDVAADGVDAVWNNEAYEDFRRQHMSLSPPEVCRHCAIYSGAG